METALDTALGKSQYAIFCTISLATLVLLRYSIFDQGGKYPILNSKKRLEFSNNRVVQYFIENSKDLLIKARSMYKNNLYKAYTEWGEVLIIPPEFVDELKSHRQLDFRQVASDDSHGYIPGFEPLGSSFNIVPLVNKYLTRALAKLTLPLSEEASLGVSQIFTESPEWHEIQPQQAIIKLVSRMSSRVFMGEALCRDEEWLKVSGEYTVQVFGTGDELGKYPRWSRPFVHWLMPSCMALRKKLADARQCLQPHIDRRNVAKQQAIAEGRPSPFNDSIEWFEKEFTGHDQATEQLRLTLVAIHTTTDLLMETMFNIALRPELFKPLREELVEVLGAEGLKKTSLYNMKLMDSVIKESQRLRPILLGNFRRRALADITLPNGDIVKKGTRITCTSTHMWEDAYYENAKEFDAYRFLRMRQTPGQDNHAHLVSTSSSHLGFGHGKHACPGRFFAANEIKIALCHLLLKYDWKLPEGVVPTSTAMGMGLTADLQARLLFRRREAELNIDALGLEEE